MSGAISVANDPPINSGSTELAESGRSLLGPFRYGTGCKADFAALEIQFATKRIACCPHFRECRILNYIDLRGIVLRSGDGDF